MLTVLLLCLALPQAPPLLALEQAPPLMGDEPIHRPPAAGWRWDEREACWWRPVTRPVTTRTYYAPRLAPPFRPPAYAAPVRTAFRGAAACAPGG